MIVATGALVAPPAHADATYDLVLTGLVEHTVDCWESVAVFRAAHDQLSVDGMLTVVVDSSADGTYTNAAFESLTLTSNVAAGPGTQISRSPSEATG